MFVCEQQKEKQHDSKETYYSMFPLSRAASLLCSTLIEHKSSNYSCYFHLLNILWVFHKIRFQFSYEKITEMFIQSPQNW